MKKPASRSASHEHSAGLLWRIIDSLRRGVDPFLVHAARPRGGLCLRVLTGLLALYFVLSHSADLVRWLGPDGILNIDTTQRLTGAEQLRSSFHYSYFYWANAGVALDPARGGRAGGAGLHAGFLVALSSIGALVVVLAYVHRAPLLTGQLEPVLTMLLAYLCLAPTGHCWSVDAWRADAPKNSRLAGRGNHPACRLEPTSARV